MHYFYFYSLHNPLSNSISIKMEKWNKYKYQKGKTTDIHAQSPVQMKNSTKSEFIMNKKNIWFALSAEIQVFGAHPANDSHELLCSNPIMYLRFVSFMKF